MVLLEGDLPGPSLIAQVSSEVGRFDAHACEPNYITVQNRFDTIRFDTNSSSHIAQKFRSLQVYSLRVNKKNILGEYSSFFKPSR